MAAFLAGCGGAPDGPAPEETGVPDAIASTAPRPKSVVNGKVIGTPMKDRVATIGLLNKRNNLTQDLVMKPGDSRRVGNVVVKVAACERSAPWEKPVEEGAFVQVFVQERATAQEQLAWRKVFSGWLFKNSPALNVVEHPVYDVWVKKCAMNFPGEEESPASEASDKSASKPSGSARTAPAPTHSSSAAPEPAASPAAAAPEPAEPAN